MGWGDTNHDVDALVSFVIFGGSPWEQATAFWFSVQLLVWRSLDENLQPFFFGLNVLYRIIHSRTDVSVLKESREKK